MTAPADHQRILLCRPASGLNDNLSQIGAACRHGERFGRKVIVEGDFATARYVKDAFSNYFVSADPNLVLDAGPYRDRFDRLDVAPDFLFGRVNGYVAEWVPAERLYRDAETKSPLTIDLSKDHAATLLVHHAHGANGPAFEGLSRIRLHGRLLDALGQRLRAIGGPYSAIHIRNTDVECDYAPQIEHIKSEVQGPVFLATDDRRAVAFVRAVFGEARVFSFASLPEQPVAKLHADAPADEVFVRNSDAILDLLMLALARQLWILQVKPGLYGGRYSGFSLLARRLKETPWVVRRLLGDAGAVAGVSA